MDNYPGADEHRSPPRNTRHIWVGKGAAINLAFGGSDLSPDTWYTHYSSLQEARAIFGDHVQPLPDTVPVTVVTRPINPTIRVATADGILIWEDPDADPRERRVRR